MPVAEEDAVEVDEHLRVESGIAHLFVGERAAHPVGESLTFIQDNAEFTPRDGTQTMAAVRARTALSPGGDVRVENVADRQAPAAQGASLDAGAVYDLHDGRRVEDSTERIERAD